MEYMEYGIQRKTDMEYGIPDKLEDRIMTYHLWGDKYQDKTKWKQIM